MSASSLKITPFRTLLHIFEVYLYYLRSIHIERGEYRKLFLITCFKSANKIADFWWYSYQKITRHLFLN